MATMKFEIKEAGYFWLKEKLEKLSKRSLKLGGQKIYPAVIGYRMTDDLNPKKIYEVVVSNHTVSLEGWEFVATIDHSPDTGNIIRTISSREIPTNYYKVKPVCDHCKVNRFRRDTFIVYNESTGEYAQVGSSCLKDFIGHPSVETYVSLAKLYAQIGGFVCYAMEYDEEKDEGGYRSRKYYDVERLALLAARDAIKRGYVSKKAAIERGVESTADIVADEYGSLDYSFTTEEREIAENAIEWAKNIDVAKASNYEYNLYIVANEAAVEARSIGYVCGMVGSYINKINRERKLINTVGTISEYIGNVKDKLAIDATVNKFSVTRFETYKYEFIDENGNILVWFASKQNDNIKIGEKVKILVTIKDHQEFNNVKQTLVTRVKLA